MSYSIGTGGRMRSLFLVPLAAAALGAASCGSPSPAVEAGQVPQRDLTLQRDDAPKVEVTSPVELARALPAEHRTATRARKARRPAGTTVPVSRAGAPAVADVPAPSPAAVAGAAPASPASYEPPDPQALAPGQTVTVLPASAGSGAAPATTDDPLPDAQRGDSRGVTIRGGHGGSCGGRGGHGGSPGLRGLR
jgi:hypothetical protein